MQQNFLDYEQPIAELEAKIDELRYMSSDSDDLNITEEIQKLQDKTVGLTESIFANLTPWQVTQIVLNYTRATQKKSYPIINSLSSSAASCLSILIAKFKSFFESAFKNASSWVIFHS